MLPRELIGVDLSRRTVVVFDVLRATTTMVAALDVGVDQIRIFADVHSARRAARQFGNDAILCGEIQCLPPPDFDLGNSPGLLGPGHAGKTVFMATSNGTRAIVAAEGAQTILIGALVNAAAIAKRMAGMADPILLCAGTNGQVAMEDLLGAGAVISELRSRRPIELASDAARIGARMFDCAKADLLSALTEAQGGKNVIAAGLADDIHFAARLNAIDRVGIVQAGTVRPL